MQCNWKIAAENFAGDSYHTPHTHASIVDIGLFREPTANKRKEGALYLAGGGGGTTYKLPTEDAGENLAYVGYPPEMVERMREAWTPEHLAMVGPGRFMVSAATAFPNLSFVHNWPQVRREGGVVPFVSVRLWQPISATETECLSWFAVDASAPDDFKEASYRAYLLCFGASGMFEQDDVENWTSITNMAKGRLGSQVELDSTMGMAPGGGTLGRPPEQWYGPGSAVVGYGEYNQRALLAWWARPAGRPRRRRSAVGERGVAAPPGHGGTRFGRRGLRWPRAWWPASRARPAWSRDPAGRRGLVALGGRAARQPALPRLARPRGRRRRVPHAGDRHPVAWRRVERHGLLHEDRYALEKRVERLEGDHAWTEEPPSRARRFVSNIRVSPGAADDEVVARSYLLMYRSRGDDRAAELLSAERTDRLRRVPGGWALVRREVTVDDSVLRMQNLALFV